MTGLTPCSMRRNALSVGIGIGGAEVEALSDSARSAD